jgi:hypothetical protein
MAYDAANDKVLLVLHSAHYDKPDNLGVYEYDPTTIPFHTSRLFTFE